MSSQVEMVTLEELVSDDHIYRKFKELWDFSDIRTELEKVEIDSDHKGLEYLDCSCVYWFNLWKI